MRPFDVQILEYNLRLKLTRNIKIFHTYLNIDSGIQDLTAHIVINCSIEYNFVAAINCFCKRDATLKIGHILALSQTLTLSLPISVLSYTQLVSTDLLRMQADNNILHL